MKFREYIKLKKEVDKELSVRHIERDEDGRAIINMTVNDDSDFLSPFSENNVAVISSSVADFIEDNTRALRPSEKLTLKIHSDCIDENEKKAYKNGIKEYYAERYLANEKEIKRNYFIALILLVFGVLVLGVSVFLNNHDIQLWSYIVDISLLVNRTLSIQRKRYLAFLSMNIEYVGIEKGDLK